MLRTQQPPRENSMRPIRFIAAVVCALVAAPALADNFTVTANTVPNRYDPALLTIHTGDTVTFTNAGGFHNVVSDDDSVTAFRCANGCDETGGNGDPDNPGWTATVAFPTAGTAPYHCEVHGTAMAGTITILATGAPTISIDQTSLSATAEAGTSTSIAFTIANTGDADLTWNADTAGTDCATPDSVPWLSLDPLSGTVAVDDPAANVDVTLDAASLAAGVHDANVCIHSNDAAHDPLTLPVTFTVTTPDLIFENGFDGPE
jgi:plastocyanin